MCVCVCIEQGFNVITHHNGLVCNAPFGFLNVVISDIRAAGLLVNNPDCVGLMHCLVHGEQLLLVLLVPLRRRRRNGLVS